MSYSYVFTNKPLSKEFENSSENEKLLNGQKMNGHKMTFLSDQGFVAKGVSVVRWKRRVVQGWSSVQFDR